jgi:peptide/nickel transport system permease protein
MLNYIIRRLLIGIPTLLGAILLLFLIFFTVSEPKQMAINTLGEKANAEDIRNWEHEHGYAFSDETLEKMVKDHFGTELDSLPEKEADKKRSQWKEENSYIPNFYNQFESGLGCLTETTFYGFMKKMITFDFGKSDYDKERIWVKIKHGVIPSLAVTVPIFVTGLIFSIFISMLTAMFRRSYIDTSIVTACIVAMSVVYFLYIIGLQFIMAKMLMWFPISGWSPDYMLHFLILPFIIGTIATVGESTRFYRTIMINEINSDYIRTARAKGLGDMSILVKHLLKNAMIPILTRVILALPFLVTGSLLLESFFGIPGLGRMTVDAINLKDLPTLSAVTYLSSIIYVLANIVSDISYTFVDPRVKLS